MAIVRTVAFCFVAVAVATGISSAPAGAQQGAAFKPPKAGVVFEYRLTMRFHSRKKVLTRTGTVVAEVLADRSPYNGTPAYRVRSTTRMKREGKPDSVSAKITVRRLADGNEIAELTDKGKLDSEKSPHSGHYAWPATVGKSWRTKVVTSVPGKGKPRAANVISRIEAIEDVTVPAGTFKTVRAVSQSGKTAKSVSWFAPALGVEAKASLVAVIFVKIEVEMVLVKMRKP